MSDLVSQAKQDALVLLAQKGDEKAMGLLYELYQPTLLRFAWRQCHSPELAKDAVQEVWLKSFRTLPRLRDPRAYKAWLFRAVRWQIVDQLRKVRSQENLREVLKQDAAQPQVVTTDETDDFAVLAGHIAQLSEVEKDALYLFYQDGLKLDEIALILGVPTGTVKSRLNRARNRLKEEMEKADESG